MKKKLLKVIKLVTSLSEGDRLVAHELLLEDMELFYRYTALVYIVGDVPGKQETEIHEKLKKLLEVNPVDFFYASDSVYTKNPKLIVKTVKKILNAK